MASYKHRQNLVNLLNQIQVLTTTTSQDLNAMIGSISRELTISYFDKDLTKKERHHNDPLHITVDAKGRKIQLVLIDDESALNVCPLKIASCLGLSIEDFVPTDQHVRAYNNNRWEVLGTVTLEPTIGQMIKKVEFLVLNIASCFNMLLGRPWIHDTEVVPSSLYQKFRFPHEGVIVTIYGDTLTAPKPIFGSKFPNTFDGFEIESPGFERREEEVEKIPMDFALYSNNNVVAMMRRMNYIPRMNLGKTEKKPTIKVPMIPTATPPFGLGYKPTDDLTIRVLGGLPLALKSLYEARTNDEDEEGGEALSDDDEGSNNESDSSGDSGDGEDDSNSDSESNDIKSIKFVKNSFPYNMISVFAYLLALNVFISEISKENLNNKGLKQGHLEPIKEEPINLGTNDEPKMIQVGNTPTTFGKDALVAQLTKFKEIFAWSYEDMLGIDTDIVQHYIPTDPTMKPVNQKLRRMKPEWTLKIKEEVEK
ncbi:uncharacterized protein LOC142635060 [Castanea sativa]|uniref:uncharacterized protein LOC142635060 n=1 Tax=Castanea sativa TaxID=21020 RepID=UPI003F650C01